MNIENTQSPGCERCIEFCILSVIKAGDSIHIRKFCDTLKKAKYHCSEGVYPSYLPDLKNDGLLNYRWEEST
jgi:PadR family transcriptional regulator PadR